MLIKFPGHDVPERLTEGEAAFSGPEPALMCLAVGVPGLAAPIGLSVARDLPVDALIAFSDAGSDRFYWLAGEPQLSDTPTCDEAAEPLSPCRINSKYRRLTLGGILFAAYLGIGVLQNQDSQRPLDTAPCIRSFTSTRSG